MGFKKMFKVRQPGHGEAFEKKVLNAGQTKLNAGSLKPNDFNSKDKKEVK